MNSFLSLDHKFHHHHFTTALLCRLIKSPPPPPPAPTLFIVCITSILISPFLLILWICFLPKGVPTAVLCLFYTSKFVLLIWYIVICTFFCFHKGKIQQDATMYQNFIILFLYEAQHVSGDTPTISAGQRPQTADLLRSWVRIPPGAWIFVCCECRVLSGRGLCDELITRPEESYRLWRIVVCDLETSRIGVPYTGCPRRNVPDFGRVFLMFKYTDITQNTYVQSWTVTEIMAREVWNCDSCYTLVDYQIHIKTGRNMWFL